MLASVVSERELGVWVEPTRMRGKGSDFTLSVNRTDGHALSHSTIRGSKDQGKNKARGNFLDHVTQNLGIF
jgi:hypothetical protein